MARLHHQGSTRLSRPRLRPSLYVEIIEPLGGRASVTDHSPLVCRAGETDLFIVHSYKYHVLRGWAVARNKNRDGLRASATIGVSKLRTAAGGLRRLAKECDDVGLKQEIRLAADRIDDVWQLLWAEIDRPTSFLEQTMQHGAEIARGAIGSLVAAGALWAGTAVWPAVIEAEKEILAACMVIADDIAPELKPSGVFAELSPNEFQIVSGKALQYSHQQIADELELNRHIIPHHLSEASIKLGFESIREMIRAFYDEYASGLVEEWDLLKLGGA